VKSTVTGIALSTALALTSAAAIGGQTTPSYLAQFRSAGRIRADVRGVDDMETAAKQAPIFWQLRELVYDLALTQHRTERQFTPDERHMRGEYYAARYQAIAPYGEPDARNQKWLSVSARFENDRFLRDEVFKTYFTPQLRAAVYAALREPMPRGTRADVHLPVQCPPRERFASDRQVATAMPVVKASLPERPHDSGSTEVQCHTRSWAAGDGDRATVVALQSLR